MTRPALLLIAVAALLFLALVFGTAANGRPVLASGTTRVSVSTEGAQANGNSGQPDVSYNGHIIVFESS